MKTQKTSSFNLKSILYLSLLGIILSFSAFSCEVFAPLEVRIENKTGYDLTEIRSSQLEISSLKNGQTSDYVSLEEFIYLRGASVVITEKFKRNLSSASREEWNGGWCGTGMDWSAPENNPNTLESGKHTFVLTIEKGTDDETLYFEKK